MSMCRTIWTATACWLLYGSPLLATPVEFGVQFEAASFFKQGSTDERPTFVSIPSARSLYILWFPGENASFGPYFAFHSSWGDLHSWHSYAGALVSYYPRGYIQSRIYMEGQFGGLFFDGNREDMVTGAGLGFQLRRGKSFVWHVKVNYTRWIEYEHSDISVIFALGTRSGE